MLPQTNHDKLIALRVVILLTSQVAFFPADVALGFLDSLSIALLNLRRRKLVHDMFFLRK